MKKSFRLKKKAEGGMELDYFPREKLTLTPDVYGLTIAANMTKNCSPVQLNISLQYCMIVFMIQVSLSIYYSYDFLTFKQFQPFKMNNTCLRLICALLL